VAIIARNSHVHQGFQIFKSKRKSLLVGGLAPDPQVSQPFGLVGFVLEMELSIVDLGPLVAPVSAKAISQPTAQVNGKRLEGKFNPTKLNLPM
jgi:hypothetical protein